MRKRFKIIYTGELKSDANPPEVLRKLCEKFKLSPEDAKKLVYSGNMKVVKKNVTADTANKYKIILEEIGLTIKVMQINSYASTDSIFDKSLPSQEKKYSTDSINDHKEKPVRKQNNNQDLMGMPRFMVLFAVTYTIGLLMFFVFSPIFALHDQNMDLALDVRDSSFFVVIATLFSFGLFVRYNKRGLTKKEKVGTVTGFLLIIVAVHGAAYLYGVNVLSELVYRDSFSLIITVSLIISKIFVIWFVLSFIESVFVTRGIIK
jgi:hypothetical protein